MGGIFGVVAESHCATDLFYGVDYHSHLGTRRAGMVTYEEKEKIFNRSIHSIESSYFRTKFESELSKFKGNMGIGVISDTDPQPIVINSHLGRYAIVTVARVVNLDELEKELIDAGVHFGELSSGRTNPTELIALLINRGATFEEGIKNVYDKVKGSCSLLILTETGLIAARDKLGRTPLVVGHKPGAYCVASESTAFANLDFEYVRDLGPAEIVSITPRGIEVLSEPRKEMQICSFLWVYYGFPTSCYEGISAEQSRFHSGEVMGRTDNTEVDCACGIPDSGVGMALGYAAGHGIPYKRCILKYTPTWPRSFMPANQLTRDLVAKMKLIPNGAVLKGKRALFCDDSIVRGTQLNDNVSELYKYGAKEVHMRIACPPLIYGCPFIGFTSSKSDMELLTRRVIEELEGDPNKNLDKYSTTGTPEYERMVEKIKERFGLTSLKFNPIEVLVESIGLPKKCICTHCFDGSSHF